MRELLDKFCDLADALLEGDEGINEGAFIALISMADTLGIAVCTALKANVDATDGRFYYREGFTLRGYKA
jgi:hypothetical protein